MSRKLFVSLTSTLVTVGLASTAVAQLPSIGFQPINSLGRTFGFGLSDGYHECRDPFLSGLVGNVQNPSGHRGPSSSVSLHDTASVIGPATPLMSKFQVSGPACNSCPQPTYNVGPAFGPANCGQPYPIMGYSNIAPQVSPVPVEGQYSTQPLNLNPVPIQPPQISPLPGSQPIPSPQPQPRPAPPNSFETSPSDLLDDDLQFEQIPEAPRRVPISPRVEEVEADDILLPDDARNYRNNARPIRQSYRVDYYQSNPNQPVNRYR